MHCIVGHSLLFPKKSPKNCPCVTTATPRTLLASPGRLKHSKPSKLNHLATYSAGDKLASRVPKIFVVQDLQYSSPVTALRSHRPCNAGINWTRIPRCITGAKARVAVSTARFQGEERMCVIYGICSRFRCAKSSHCRSPRGVNPPNGELEKDLYC